MANQKYLKGELKYVEGSSTIKEFLKTFTSKVVKQDWVSFDRKEGDKAWAFGINREIHLGTEFRPDNIRLYKATLDSNNEWQKGDLIPQTEYEIIKDIIRGKNQTSNNGTQINDRVLIEVTYDNTIFQQTVFLEDKLPSGQLLPFAKLKSRPQGDIKVFEEQVQERTKEKLHQKGGNQFYLFNATPVSQAKDKSYSLKIYKNDTLVNEDEYRVDYINGVVMFKDLLQDNDVISATYGYKTGFRGNEINNTKYKVNQNRIIDVTANKELKNKDIIVDVNFYWEIEYPAKIADITESVIIKTKVDISRNGDRKKLKEYFVEFRYMDFADKTTSADYKTGVQVRFGTKLKTDAKAKATGAKTLDDALSSTWAKFSWYKKTALESGTGIVFDEWLPIRFGVNFTKEYMNIFIQGDSSPDNKTDENHYLVSYAYIGMLKEYENAKNEDLENNFAITVGSGEKPATEIDENNTYGIRTGNAVTDVTMYKTNSNLLFQAHNVAFHTTPEFMDKNYITSSAYTEAYHFSEISVVHFTEGARGRLQGVIIGDVSAIFHMDELTLNKDTFDLRGALAEGTEVFDENGNPFKSRETKWKTLRVNQPYSFLNNSPNTLYGICIRTE